MLFSLSAFVPVISSSYSWSNSLSWLTDNVEAWLLICLDQTPHFSLYAETSSSRLWWVWVWVAQWLSQYLINSCKKFERVGWFFGVIFTWNESKVTFFLTVRLRFITIMLLSVYCCACIWYCSCETNAHQCACTVAGWAAAGWQVWSDGVGPVTWPLSSGRGVQRWVHSCVWCALWGIRVFHHISWPPESGDCTGLWSWWDEACVWITGEFVCVCVSVKERWR